MQQRIVCLEGIVGAGKTTQILRLCSRLDSVAYLIPELNTFSPLKEEIAKWKKRALKEGKVFFLKEDIINLAKARAETQRRNLITNQYFPYALSDRSVFTSAIFECGEVSPKKILDINYQEGVLFPDYGFVLDCTPEEALRRIDKRRAQSKRYLGRSIQENLEEIEKRRRLYIDLLGLFPQLTLIDSMRSEDEVFEEIMSCIKKWT